MTQYLVATNVVNLHQEPTSRSEVVSQVILGDPVEAGLEQDGYFEVTTSDRYRGWIAATHFVPAWDFTDFLSTSIATLFADIHESPDAQSDLISKLVVSSRVVLAHAATVGEFVPLILPNKTVGYVHNVCLDVTHDRGGNQVALADPQARRSSEDDSLKPQILRRIGVHVVDIGKKFIGTPYLWGGCTPFGIDCSGFVQLAYKLSGLQLLRDGELQFNDRRFERCDHGQSLDESDLLAGDIVAFRRQGSELITHVGMAMGDGRFIHSSGGRGVHIDRCVAEPYASTYAGAVRLSPNADLAIDAA